MSKQREVIIDTIQSVGYFNSVDNPELFFNKYYEEAPFFVTKNTSRIQQCNGWDIVNGVVMPGSDVLFQVFPTYFYQIMRDWTTSADPAENSTFSANILAAINPTTDEKIKCRKCGFKLTTQPASLRRFCLSCYIDVQPVLQVETRIALFHSEKEKAFPRIMNDLYCDLLSDNIVRGMGPQVELVGVWNHFLTLNGYPQEIDFENFTLFEDFDCQTLKEVIVDDFVNSMNRQPIGIHLFTGIQMIKQFIDDLYDPYILEKLIPGHALLLTQDAGEDEDEEFSESTVVMSSLDEE